jgi:hypothetical protein
MKMPVLTTPDHHRPSSRSRPKDAAPLLAAGLLVLLLIGIAFVCLGY